MKIIDIKDMPNANFEVKDGMNSVSSGKVTLGITYFLDNGKIGITDIDSLKTMIEAGENSKSINMIIEEMKHMYPICKQHGAMNKVSPYGIWRCLTCGEGCYETTE